MATKDELQTQVDGQTATIFQKDGVIDDLKGTIQDLQGVLNELQQENVGLKFERTRAGRLQRDAQSKRDDAIKQNQQLLAEREAQRELAKADKE